MTSEKDCTFLKKKNEVRIKAPKKEILKKLTVVFQGDEVK